MSDEFLTSNHLTIRPTLLPIDYAADRYAMPITPAELADRIAIEQRHDPSSREGTLELPPIASQLGERLDHDID